MGKIKAGRYYKKWAQGPKPGGKGQGGRLRQHSSGVLSRVCKSDLLMTRQLSGEGGLEN